MHRRERLAEDCGGVVRVSVHAEAYFSVFFAGVLRLPAVRGVRSTVAGSVNEKQEQVLLFTARLRETVGQAGRRGCTVRSGAVGASVCGGR